MIGRIYHADVPCEICNGECELGEHGEHLFAIRDAKGVERPLCESCGGPNGYKATDLLRALEEKDRRIAEQEARRTFAASGEIFC